MEGLEQLLGFRINGNADSCVEHRRVEILSADGESIKAVRPATVQEVDMWMALLGHEDGMRQAAEAFRKATESAANRVAELEADKRSLEAANEAYRLQQVRLYDGIKYIVHIEPTDDAVEKALQLINVAHNQPQAAEAAEKRRHEYVNRIAGRPVRDNPQA